MLFAILTKVLGFLSGGILDRVFNYMEKRGEQANDRERLKVEIIKEQIKAEVANRAANSELLRVEHGWWVTAMIRPLFAYPLIVWWTAMLLDNVFDLGWGMRPLPSPADEWAGWIITAYFLTRPLEKIGRAFVQKK